MGVAVGDLFQFRGGMKLLTESEVERSFRKLFKGKEISSENIERAEALLEHLRAESPLRFRLGAELTQLRELCLSNKA